MTSKQTELRGFISYTEPPADTTVIIPPTETEQLSDISKSTNPTSIEVISKQLKSAAERRAGFVSKAILKEFEHQIIARKQSSKAELFITAILLLLSTERICCFVKQFDSAPHTSSALKTTATGSNVDPSLAPLVDFNNSPLERDDSQTSWPLDRGPEHFWQQGEQFSSVIALMLKLRLVTPKMVVGDDGFIHGKETEDDELKLWLEGLKLTSHQLDTARQKPFDTEDNDFWELKWACKPFLA